jgi:hypothetical protein
LECDLQSSGTLAGHPILHFTLYILHSSGPVVGARCRPPKSKINLLSANGYSPSTENGGIVPYHNTDRNRSDGFSGLTNQAI